MPQIIITIGGRNFEVACQSGEEDYLLSAAALLDNEASALTGQIGRVPEAQMLLMAGLMLADKMVAGEERIRAAEEAAETAKALAEAALTRPAPEPERIEVPVMPAGVADTLLELAARAEALADEVEQKASV